jgi:hypothetical protein
MLLCRRMGDVTSTGPAGFANLKAYAEGKPVRYTVEVPFYSDALLVGEVREGMGPLVILNTVPLHTGFLEPALVLRCAIHDDFGQEELLATKDLTRFSGTSHFDEIACYLSLQCGARIVASEPTRVFDGKDPLGTPRGERSPRIVRTQRGPTAMVPWCTGNKRLEPGLMASLHVLSPREALALARAARSFRDALLAADSDPQLAWLLIVSGIEVLASHHNVPADDAASARLRAAAPDLVTTLEILGPSAVDVVAPHLAPLFKATARFLKFFRDFPPPPPEKRPPPGFQFRPWADLERALSVVYKWRSLALHEAIPFPPPMCEPPYTGGAEWEAPCETVMGLSVLMQGGYWTREQAPFPFNFFAQLARSSMLAWWTSRTTAIEIQPEN